MGVEVIPNDIENPNNLSSIQKWLSAHPCSDCMHKYTTTGIQASLGGLDWKSLLGKQWPDSYVRRAILVTVSL